MSEFDLSSAFADFETPEEALEKRQTRLRSERLDRSVDQTPEERLADTSGAMLAKGLRQLTGTKTQDQKVAEAMAGAFRKVAETSVPIPQTSDQVPEEDQAKAMEGESRAMELTGSQAEAKYLKEGLSSDEARLKALDDVIKTATIPEVARQLIHTRAAMAADISERRKMVAVLKAQGVDEQIDRATNEAILAGKEQDLEDRGLEVLKLLDIQDGLIEKGEPEDSVERTAIRNRILKLAPEPEVAGTEDPTTRRRRDTIIEKASQNVGTALGMIADTRDFLGDNPFAKTSTSAIGRFADNLMIDVESVHPGFGAWARETLEAEFGDFSKYGENSARFRAMANMLILTQTDALIDGVPSNFDVKMIQDTLAKSVRDPAIFGKVMNDQAKSMIKGYRWTAISHNRGDHFAVTATNKLYDDRFLTGPRLKREAEERAKQVSNSENFDVKGSDLDALLAELDNTAPQEIQ